MSTTYDEAILNESENLVENLNKANEAIDKINNVEIIQIMDKLRNIEKKMNLVYTFFQRSMYSRISETGGEAVVVQESNTNRPPL